MNELNEKLLKIIQELNVPKSRYNSFGNYNYRSLEDIYESVKPLLAKYNLSLRMTDTIEAYGDRVYVKATATLSDGDNSHDVSAYAREAVNKKGMDDSQITGTASSYARKYALSGLFLLDDIKDADTEEYTRSTTVSASNGKSIPADDKPWLNEGTPEWEQAEDYVKNGGNPKNLRKRFAVSKPTMQYFESIQPLNS
jgi:hypothetical protein